MIENVMRNMGGVAVFGIISITLFFAFFTGMFFWAIRLKKPYLTSMQELPLDCQENPPTQSLNLSDKNRL
ncbi:MAG TPA: CcoQ/FixQ family Cbb3-type cytochrome c oxidase assembly chaperone [Candidatus Dormibacteraeota bacterium]|nr:CcoQ/FixQ family Cbb3-type cytochrome c oxidase assembly chaperone [Candidatus Dormibacteraeota bacterium]